MDLLIVFDADNTLWDTDSVFRSAERAMLRVLPGSDQAGDPAGRQMRLREIDFELVRVLGRLEYDYRLLASAAAGVFAEGTSMEEAVRRALAGELRCGGDGAVAATAEESYRVYTEALSAIPVLDPDAVQLLRSIRAASADGHRVVMMLFSEGERGRMEMVLRAHGMDGDRLFDEIVLGPKSRDSFERVKKMGLDRLTAIGTGATPTTVMVGDSLQRDIVWANEVGFVTAYRPSSFRGDEVARTPGEMPVYRLRRLGELLPILRGLGLTGGREGDSTAESAEGAERTEPPRHQGTKRDEV